MIDMIDGKVVCSQVNWIALLRQPFESTACDTVAMREMSRHDVSQQSASDPQFR